MSTTSDSSMKDTSGTSSNDFADAEKNFKPKTLKFWAILMCIYASLFLVALDRIIISTAIPAITNEFGSISDIGWYGSAYMLTCAITNPTYGRLYQLYPTKWVYLISIIIFEVGSAICGAAPSSTCFIVGRAIAGMGAAGICKCKNGPRVCIHTNDTSVTSHWWYYDNHATHSSSKAPNIPIILRDRLRCVVNNQPIGGRRLHRQRVSLF
jgi:hypothetical protein